jgi:hypothetical protein
VDDMVFVVMNSKLNAAAFSEYLCNM